jgi:alginate O-acetyltransferase complex protein AlgI
MIFSSTQFILIFLPVSFFGYFLLNKCRFIVAGKAWLVAMSLLFYAYWNISYLPLMLSSIAFNFYIGSIFCKQPINEKLLISRRLILISGITANLALLGYFKYANFLVDNINAAFEVNYALPEIILPLGISFFTFTQIAYLVDSYQGKVKEYDLLNYTLFVTFFPHLIAGPILHHREMMTQFSSRWAWAIRYRNIYFGLFIFSIGFFKKTILADTFAVWANEGFDNRIELDFFSAWATSLAYTFQLYFDFSGYCDMAIGAALLFNIWLPINFNSPYKAFDIQDFWRRWHITLSRFLRDYLYHYFNLITTFVLGGLWHGADWMFVIWGTLHGLALVVHQAWKKFHLRMPKAIAWLITFSFINITWVFFRAETLEDAYRILRGMIDIDSIFNLSITSIPTSHLAWSGWLADYMLTNLPAGLASNILCYISISLSFFIISQKNSFELMVGKYTNLKLFGSALLFCIAMYSTLISKTTVFLYFNF